MISRRKIVSLRAVSLVSGICGLIAAACGPKSSNDTPVLGATLEAEQQRVFLVLRNWSAAEFFFCTKNVYDAVECLAIRRHPDTVELPPETIFGRRTISPDRSFITVSDYISLGPGQKATLPVDLRGIRYNRASGDSVFLAVTFKNIDPFSCSKVEVSKHDKATQEYCGKLHFIPAKTCTYWSGEVRTPYKSVCLRRYTPPPPSKKSRKFSREIVVRRSKTHPIKKKVF